MHKLATKYYNFFWSEPRRYENTTHQFMAIVAHEFARAAVLAIMFGVLLCIITL